MSRLAAIVGAMLGILLVPLALIGQTAWLVVPSHALFAVLVTIAAVADGVTGRPERARVWGAGYLVCSIATIAALQVGSSVEGRAYWIGPWMAMLVWGWIPPIAAGLAGWLGDGVRSWRSNRAVRQRKSAGRAIPAPQEGS